MVYMCMECYEVYEHHFESCPKTNCDGFVEEIDELMLPIIKILNEKGYITKHCCSGHIYDTGAGIYIMFEQFLYEILTKEEIEAIFTNLPAGFVLELGHNGFTIRYNFASSKQDASLDVYKEILNAHLSLLNFVNILPCLEY